MTAAQIYEHLDTMYNMEAVEELENASPQFTNPPQPGRKLTLKDDDEDSDDSDDSEDDNSDEDGTAGKEHALSAPSSEKEAAGQTTV